MKITKINIAGVEYPICFSTRVAIDCEEHAGNVELVLHKIEKENSIKETFWLISKMIDAGCKYENMNGNCVPDPISYDDLIDKLGPDDYSVMFGAILDAIKDGTKREIKVKSTKNGKNAETR